MRGLVDLDHAEQMLRTRRISHAIALAVVDRSIRQPGFDARPGIDGVNCNWHQARIAQALTAGLCVAPIEHGTERRSGQRRRISVVDEIRRNRAGDAPSDAGLHADRPAGSVA